MSQTVIDSTSTYKASRRHPSKMPSPCLVPLAHSPTTHYHRSRDGQKTLQKNASTQPLHLLKHHRNPDKQPQAQPDKTTTSARLPFEPRRPNPQPRNGPRTHKWGRDEDGDITSREKERERVCVRWYVALYIRYRTCDMEGGRNVEGRRCDVM